MSADPLAVLAGANPISQAPDVAPVETLDFDRGLPPASASRWPRKGTQALIVAGLVLVLALAWLGLGSGGGPSTPGLDIAAAAYAASASGAGVIEAEFRVIRYDEAPPRRITRHREWIDPRSGARREQIIGPNGNVIDEAATWPGWGEARANGQIFRTGSEPAGVGGALAPGLDLYRRLYQNRGEDLKLVGRERVGRHSFWRLEGTWGFTRPDPNGPKIPIFGVAVLVDPATYLPVVQRAWWLAKPGHPLVLDSRMLSYRRLARSAGSERLLRLPRKKPWGRRHGCARVLHRLGLLAMPPEAASIHSAAEPTVVTGRTGQAG